MKLIYMWKFSSLKFKILISAITIALIALFIFFTVDKVSIGKTYELEDSIDGWYDVDGRTKYINDLDKAEEILDEDGNPDNINYFDLVDKDEYMTTIYDSKVKVEDKDDKEDMYLISCDGSEYWVSMKEFNKARK